MSEFKNLQDDVCEDTIAEEETKEICEDIKKNVEEQTSLEEDDFAESDFVIELTKEQILEDMKVLQRIFLQYTKFQSLSFVLKFEKLYWEKNPFYFTKESLSIGQFLLNFKASVRYNYIKYKTSVKLNELHMVKIKVKNNKIKSISVKTKCCKYKRLKQFEKLKKTSRNIISYLKNISENEQLLQSKIVKDNWLEFSKIISEQNINSKPMFPKNEESCIDFDLISKAKDSILSKDFKITDIIQYVLSDNESKSLKERYQKDFVNDLKSELKDSASGKLYNKAKSFTSDDWVYNLGDMKDKFIKEKTENITLTKERMLDIFEENILPKRQSFLIEQVKDLLRNSDDIRDANLYSLLTPETFQKLSIKALLNKIKYFDFESSTKVTFKTIAMSLNYNKLQDMWNKLDGSTRSRIDKLVLDEVSRVMPEAINFEIPWERESKMDACDNTAERQELIKNRSIDIDYKKLKEIYINKIIEQLSIDELTESLNNLPGAGYILSVMLGKQQGDSFDLLSSFEFIPDMLKEQYTGDGSGFTLPKIPQIPNFNNIGWKHILIKLKDMLVEKLLDYVNSLIISLIVKIIETLEKKVQNEINDFLGRETDSLEQPKLKNVFKDLMAETFCEDKGKLDETEKDLLARVGVDNDLISNFIDIVGGNATTSDLVNMITGASGENSELLESLWILFQDSGLGDLFQEPSDIYTLFESIGSYLTDEQLSNMRDLTEDTDEFINNSICLTNQQKQVLDDIRKNNGIESNDDDDLSSIVGTIVNTPAGNILENLKDALQAPQDPDCYNPDDFIIEALNEDVASILNDSVDIAFSGLEQAFKVDMIGRRNSFFDNILADSKGVRLSSGLFSHERRVAYDLLFPNAADSIKQHGEKYENGGFFEKFIMDVFSPDEAPEGFEGNKPYPNHIFPETISTYCIDQINSSVESNVFETTIEPARRGKKPDYRLEFRNKNEDDDFDYGFNILYKNFLYPNQEYKRNLDTQISKVDLFKTKENPSAIQDAKIKTIVDYSEYMDIIEDLDNGEVLNKPYPNYLLENFISNKAANIVVNTSNFYDKISNSLINSVISGMIEDKNNQSGSFPAGFVFGFIDNALNNDDLTYVNPTANPNDESTWIYDHDEEDKKLGKSATENPRVVFLDPAKYGGKYTKPKLYIKEAKSKGWIELFSSVMPTDDCDDKENYLFLSDIKETVKKKQKSIKSDKRMNVDPDCVYEPAYDKLLTSSQKANLEGVIKATIRTYVTEMLLRTLPAFSHLQIDFEKNYSPLYLDYLVQKMEDEMSEVVNWPSRLRGVRYWLYFLDACVDMTFRLVKEEEITPTPELYNLLQEANEVSRNYVKPNEFDRKLLFRVVRYTHSGGLVTDVEYFGSFKVTSKEKQKTIRMLNSFFYYVYGEEYREKVSSKSNNSFEWSFVIKNILSMKFLKRIARDYDIQENRELSKSILKYLLINEVSSYKDKILGSFSRKPFIKDINKFLLGSSNFTHNNIKYGTRQSLDVSDIKTVNELVTTNPFDNAIFTQEDYSRFKQTGLYFLEHYFVLETKTGDSSLINGVKSTQEIKEILQNLEDKTKNISDYFGNAEIVDQAIEGSIGIKFGIRLCMVPPTGFVQSKAPISSFSSSKSYRMAPATVTVDGQQAVYQESQTIIPLCSFEQDIEDKKINEIDLSSSTLGEQIECYLDNLASTKEFNFIFNKLLPTNKITSLIALYYFDGFIESVGLADSEREEGKLGSKGNWREKILEETKTKVSDMFKSAYMSRENNLDVIDLDINRRQRKRIDLNIVPQIKLNIGMNVKRRKLRRIVYTHCEQDDEQLSLLESFLGD